jgi:acyl carrier protein
VQREVHYDTFSFSAALRSALRQDPDVVLIGEMRDEMNVPVFQLAGVNIPTTKGIHYFDHKSCIVRIGAPCLATTTLDHMPLKTNFGDSVVETLSAIAMDGLGYVFDIGAYNTKNKNNNTNHATIMESGPVRNFLTHVISPTHPLPLYVTETSNSAVQTMYRIAVHSPVSLHVMDSEGRVTERGRTEIPNSVYEEVGEGAYITLLSPSNNVEVLVRGTATGTFSFDVEKISGNSSETKVLFSNIPTSPQVVAQVSFRPEELVEQVKMEIDSNNDGVIDSVKLNEIVTKITKTPKKNLKEKIIKHLKKIKEIKNKLREWVEKR